MKAFRFGLPARALVSSSVALALSGAAFAQGTTTAAAPDDEDSLEQVVVTGSRRADRTAIESNVPVDVVGQHELQTTLSSDINNKLQSLVPSYNVRRLPLNDGAVFVRPATLRALSPDHTLVLVNGKRLHRSAFVDVTARGAQAPDVSLIPSTALKRVEVLRDGAAAQYGSDAIAGVVNFILDDQPGSNVFAQFGEYSEGDGQALQVGAQSGFAFGAGGHVNLSLEYVDSDATSRSVQRPQAEALIALGEPYASTVRQPYVQRFGQPDLKAVKAFLNAGVDVGDLAQIYIFGNFADTEGVSDFNWRAPAAAAGASASGAYARSRYQNGPNAIYPTWDLRSLYPGGFTPLFGFNGQDYSAVLGLKGQFTEAFSWDLSGSLGSNSIDYWLHDSINASLGPLSPTDFDAGTRTQTETNANLDFVYEWQTALPSPVNIGFGFEYRREQFEVVAGEEASWVVGPLRDLAPASNGFPGASPISAGKWSSDNTAAYVDFDVDVTEQFNVSLAGRIEDYSTFGTTSNGKVSARFAFTPTLSIRGAASTGFRAPTPGQQNLYNVSQNPNATTSVIETNGLVPSTSAGAVFFGGQALQPEESTNFSLGLVYSPLPSLQLTLDAYQIQIDDRIALSQRFSITPTVRAQLIAAGVPNASELTTIFYYANAFDTRTEGLDLVGTWRSSVGPGRLGVTLASNYNHTDITRSDPTQISNQISLQLRRALPQFTGNLSVDYAWSKWSVQARARHFGDWVWAVDATNSQLVGQETFFDLNGSYAFNDATHLALGVENLLDNYTARTQFNQAVGRKYPGQAPYDNDGRQLYARVEFRF